MDIQTLPIRTDFIQSFTDNSEKGIIVPEPKQSRGLMDLSFIGNIADAIPQITGQFNRDFQQSQVQIAQANAQFAMANAQNGNTLNSRASNGNTTTYIAIAVVVLVALFFVFKSNK